MGFGARFLAFALLAGFAFFIPFFCRARALRFAFLDFFATFASRSVKRKYANTAPYRSRLSLNLAARTASLTLPSSIIPNIVATCRTVCGLTNVNGSQVASV